MTVRKLRMLVVKAFSAKSIRKHGGLFTSHRAATSTKKPSTSGCAVAMVRGGWVIHLPQGSIDHVRSLIAGKSRGLV